MKMDDNSYDNHRTILQDSMEKRGAFSEPDGRRMVTRYELLRLMQAADNAIDADPSNVRGWMLYIREELANVHDDESRTI